ncbi:transmembrane protein 151B-like [Ptychodera flava]|uniref:transmembrane protein 151B-like n=1 Tax=Ptychodera flava TaxID=63121 RepID=UPI00396AA614
MNNATENQHENRPIRQSFCGSLRRDTHWKCLILTLLIYASLGIIAWCRLTTVTLLAYNYRGTPVPMVGSPCDDGYIYIPIAFLILIYMVYLIECWHCHTRVELQYKEDVSVVYDMLQRMKEAYPVVWWRVICYHYVRRTRQVTRYRNGDAYTSTQEYYERVNSHSALGAFDFSDCGVKDISKDLVGLEDYPATKIKFTKSFIFANEEAENDYLAQRSRFFGENEGRDDYMETREGMNLSDLDFKEHMIAFAESNSLPWYVSLILFWSLSICLLSWPLRVLIEYKTAYVHYQLEKLFGTNYSTYSSMENWNGSIQLPRDATVTSSRSLEMRIRNNHHIVPSYSEALLMDAANGNIVRHSSSSRGNIANGHAVTIAPPDDDNDVDDDDFDETSPIIEGQRDGTRLQERGVELNIPDDSPPGYDVALNMMMPARQTTGEVYCTVPIETSL